MTEEDVDAQISEFGFDVTLFRMPEGEVREQALALIRDTLRHSRIGKQPRTATGT